MSAVDLLTSLYERNITLSVAGDKLKIHASQESLDQDLLASIRDNKAELIALLKDLDAKNTSQDEAALDEVIGEHFLSYEQKSMLWLDHISANKSHYNMSAAYKLVGQLGASLLTQAFRDIISAHSILRTVYVADSLSQQGQAQSQIQELSQTQENGSFELEQLIVADQKALQDCLEEQAKRAFDLAFEWPIRACLIELADPQQTNEHYLCVTLHHIAADGWSVGVFLRELSQAYNHRAQYGESYVSGQKRSQYYQYARWQQKNLSPEYQKELLSYWTQQLKELPVLHNLPLDYTRPNVQDFSGANYKQVFPKALTDRLNLFVKHNNVTPFIVFQSILAALLKRYTNNEDVVFGTVTANRTHPDMMNTIGMFANSLVLRHSIDDDCHFNDMLAQAKQVSREAFDHGQLPFDSLVEALQPERSLAFNPLVQIMLVMQEDYHQYLALDGISAEFIDNDKWVSKFDLSLHITDQDGQWQLRWEYNTHLFKASTVERIHHHFVRMAELLLNFPHTPISELPLVTLADLPLNTVSKELPVSQCVHTVFEEQARLYPNKVAVFSNSQSLTYQELDEKATRLAHQLRAVVHGQTVASPFFIGVCLERDVELVVSLLAIMKAGATYVPLDSSYPKDRLLHMLQDSAPHILITDSKINTKLGIFADQLTVLMDQVDLERPVSGPATWPSLQPSDPAYVIYTSGSTGKPKGVLVPHESLFQSMVANGNLMAFSADDTMPCLGSVAFGASLLEIFLPLTHGGAVQMLPKREVEDIADLIQHTSATSTVIHMVPSLMKMWLSNLSHTSSAERRQLYPDLRLVLTGGEAVPKHILDEFALQLPNVAVLGMYGMTEAAIVCFSHEPQGAHDPINCLGVPHEHMNAFVLNARQQLQPVGCAGELHLHGVSLAQGYLNQADYTKERFIHCDLDILSQQRLYKTGDYARLLGDGRFEFLGRTDNQVSIRGFRIELGEIESVLRQHPDIKDALVTVREVSDHGKQLVAYVTTDKEQQFPSNQALRDYVSDDLPSYMIPSFFVALASFPLNPNGKVNRHALPEIDFAKNKKTNVSVASEQEQQLLEIWSEVLEIPEDSISTESNFFALGGDSILTLKIIEKMRALGMTVTPQLFFQNQTIAELAKAISATCETVQETEQNGPLPLTPTQKTTLAMSKKDRNQFHGAIMREVANTTSAEHWYQVIEQLFAHHSGLRAVFSHTDQTWTSEILPIEQHNFFEAIDVTHMDESERTALIDQCTHQTIDIINGPLVKLYLFENWKTDKNAILFILHHLVMDRVSMDVLSQDFYSLLFQVEQGLSFSLPEKTASLKQVVSALDELSNSADMTQDLDYWQSLPWDELSLLPTDFPMEQGPFLSSGQGSERVIEMSVEQTRELLQGVNHIPDINMQDLLISCLVNAITEHFERDWLKVNVIDNARSFLPETKGIDTSRTVGCLTLDRVLCLQRTGDSSLASIKNTSQQIQAIPHKGYSYDLLYWANEEKADSDKITLPMHPRERVLIVNYHGKIDKESQDFISVEEGGVITEFITDPQNERMSQLFADALIVDGQLIVRIYYEPLLYSQQTMEHIAHRFNEQLIKAWENLAAFEKQTSISYS